MAIISEEIYNLDEIYKDKDYFFPRAILENYLSGVAFDNKTPYTLEEKERLDADLANIYKRIIGSNPVKKDWANITIGMPGVGKTTLVNQQLNRLKEWGEEDYAYLCPDDVVLKQMETFQKELAQSDGSPEQRLALYNKYRPFSNAIIYILLPLIIEQKFALYFSTTGSSPQVVKFFDYLKKKEYNIRLLHVTAPPEVCWESIKVRDKTFIQTTKQDIESKIKLVPQRIADYLKHATEIEFYFREKVDADAELVAIWENDGSLNIKNPEKYAKLKAIHDAAVKDFPHLMWENTVEKK